MRIVKDRASAVLRNEATKLLQQVSRCEHQVNKLSGMSFGGLLGESVTTAERNVRMRAAIATAHLTFFQSLLQADRTNAQLVAALPTTSGGVLDTAVAQKRAQQARGAMKTLEAMKEQALEQARRTNEALAASVDPYAMPVNLQSLGQSYDSLINAKKAVAEHNEDILERAAQYEQEAASAYRGVEASYITGAIASSNEYLRTGRWGSATWVNQMEFNLRLAARERERASEQRRQLEQVNRFLAGDMGVEGTAVAQSAETDLELFGALLTVGAEGILLGLEGSIAPQSEPKLDPNKDDFSLTGGVEGDLEGYAAHGSVSVDAGEYVHAEGEAQLWTMSAAGTLGASLYEEGLFNPSLNAGYEAGITGLSHQESVRVGSENFNVHSQTSAELLRAESSAEVMFGAEGIGVSVEDEAYVAEGTIGRGITFMGISLDVSLTGKIGGAGATAGAKVTRDYAQGQIGLGLGAGLGFSVRVDWSGAASAVQQSWDTVQSWWNGLWNNEGD